MGPVGEPCASTGNEHSKQAPISQSSADTQATGEAPTEESPSTSRNADTAVAAYCDSCPELADPHNTCETSRTAAHSESATTAMDSDHKEDGTGNAAAGGPSSSLSKRRAAKRDSARRARAKKRDMLASLLDQTEEVAASNQALAAELVKADSSVAELSAGLSATRTRTSAYQDPE